MEESQEAFPVDWVFWQLFPSTFVMSANIENITVRIMSRRVDILAKINSKGTPGPRAISYFYWVGS